jgi:hypothetical protein
MLRAEVGRDRRSHESEEDEEEKAASFMNSQALRRWWPFMWPPRVGRFWQANTKEGASRSKAPKWEVSWSGA